MTIPGDRVLLVMASRSGTDGSQVAQLVGMVDASKGRLTVTLADPWGKVALPGTSADRLRDSYPFGGAAGVSDAYARETSSVPLPAIAVSERAFVSLVDRAGGVTVTVPGNANVFDGTRLYTFAPGVRRLSGAEVVALLSAGDFLAKPSERDALLAAVANGIADACRTDVPDVAGFVADGAITSTLKPEGLADTGRRLRSALQSVTVTAPAP